MAKPHRYRSFLIVGNPQNWRVAFFQQALRDAGRRTAAVVPYIDLLERRTTLGSHLIPGTLVRIESPSATSRSRKRCCGMASPTRRPKGRPYWPAARFRTRRLIVA